MLSTRQRRGAPPRRRTDLARRADQLDRPGRHAPLPTGIGELDRVLGGGLVPGSVTLLAGDPGRRQVDTAARGRPPLGAAPGRRALYLSGEESAGQIRLRAERTGCTHDEVYLAAESDLHDRARPHRGGATDAGRRGLGADHVDHRGRRRHRRRHPGPRGHHRADRWRPRPPASRCFSSATSPRTARSPVRGRWSTSSTWCCTSRVTAASTLRMVRGVKNRFGAADEVGCFQLHDNGIEGVADPSGLFLRPAPGAGCRHRGHGHAGRQATADRRGAGARRRRRRRHPAPRRQRHRLRRAPR